MNVDFNKLFRFTNVSGIGWILDICVLRLFLSLGLDAFISNILSSFTGVIFVFFISQKKVFITDGNVRYNLLIPYMTYNAIAIGLTSKVISMISLLIFTKLSYSISFDNFVMLIKVLITPISMFSNYLFSKWLFEDNYSKVK